MNTAKTNKLSVYLIKEEYTSPNEILKNYDQLEEEGIADVGSFFYKPTRNFKPEWIGKFFGDSIKADIVVSISSAVLLVHTRGKYFALTFGYGHSLLNHGTWEERFGLKIAMNTIGHENIRSIDKKNMSIAPKLTREQVTKDTVFADFGIDIEQDLIQGITGKSIDEKFGKTVTGKDALGVSIKVDISNIKPFLELCLEKYNEDRYKEHFGWIDNIYEVKDPKEIEKLNKKLINEIRKANLDRIWMAVPEIIEWQDVSEFKFKKNSFGNDIDIPSYLNFLSESEKQNLSPETLKKQKIICISASSQGEKHSWSIYNCLYCEIEKDKGKTNILSNGKWYQVENNFLREVSDSFNSLKTPIGLNLPICNQKEHEGDYNERAAIENPNNMYNMDKKMIYHGGVNQKIEFCDLFTKDKEMIHIKKSGTSSVLSHLFSQGSVSGELFYLDPEFRKKVNEYLPNNYKLANVDKKPDPSDYKIIFAIISNSKKDIDIPFFSKVNIKNISKKLERYGYSVHVTKISVE